VSTSEPTEGHISVAAATVDMTVGAIGLPLGGNSRSDKASRGVHEPVQATVIVLEREGERLRTVLIALDLVTLPRDLVATLESAISAAVGGITVFASATHTHSAPDVDRGNDFDLADYSQVPPWVERVVSRVVTAVRECCDRLRPATMLVGHAAVDGVAFNRRLLGSDGAVVMNWQPQADAADAVPLGPTDDRLTVAGFVAHGGEPIAAILHFALHPAILVGLDGMLSPDWVGTARRELSSQFGDVPVAFLNGAMGNVNHIDHEKPGRPIGFDEASRVGARVGGAAVQALHDAAPVSAAAFVAAQSVVSLAQRTVTEADLVDAQARLGRATPGDFDALDGIPPCAYARWVVKRGSQLSPTLDAPLAVLLVGSLVLVYVPFEVFCEFGLHLQRLFPRYTVLTVSLGGGGFGYLPTAAAFVEGGYEPTLGTSTIRMGEGERLAHEAAKLVDAITRASPGAR
jgi:hypothetical protein